jgi:hypothetical protein
MVQAASELLQRGLQASRSGDNTAAASLLEQAITKLESAQGADRPELAPVYGLESETEESLGNINAASNFAEKELRAAEKQHGKESPALIPILIHIANLDAKATHFDKGAVGDVIKRAASIVEGSPKIEARTRAQVYLAAGAYYSTESPSVAIDCYRKSIAAMETLPVDEGISITSAYSEIARLQLTSGDRMAALSCCRKVLELEKREILRIAVNPKQNEASNRLSAFTSYDLLASANEPRLLLQALLRRKAILEESLQIALDNSTPAERAKMLSLTTSLLSGAVEASRTQDSQVRQHWSERRPVLQKDWDDQQAELLKRSEVSNAVKRACEITPEMVEEALPTKSALVEYFRYRDLVSTNKSEPLRYRFGAVVLRKSGPPRFVPLRAIEYFNGDPVGVGADLKLV